MIRVVTKVQFIPAVLLGGTMTKAEKKKATICGTVVYINWKHRYFSAEYDCGCTKQRESFHLAQLGNEVLICG